MIEAHIAELRDKHGDIFGGIEEQRSNLPSPDIRPLDDTNNIVSSLTLNKS